MAERKFFLPDTAIDDIKEISIWYEGKTENLGFKFQAKVFESIDLICKFPEANAKLSKHQSTRRYLMADFPYKIFYDATKEPLLIIAVIHTSRSSQFVKKRIKQ